jgi:Skp family chaperone for outer membrane proteins
MVAVVLAGLGWGALTAYAQDADRVQGYKIGVVDFQLIMREYEKRKAEYGKLQAEVDGLQSGIDDLFKRIEALRAEYEQKVGSMSSEERIAMEQQIESLYDEYKVELAKRQRVIDRKERQVVEELIGEVRAVIAQIGEQENFHLILEANSPNPPRGGVLFFSRTIDITSKVLEYLNRGS